MALSCPVLRESSKRRLLKAARFNSFLQAVQTSTYLLQTFAISYCHKFSLSPFSTILDPLAGN